MLRNFLKKSTLLGRPLTATKRYLDLHIQRGYDIINPDRLRWRLPSPQKIHWVHPDTITWHTNWLPPHLTDPPFRDRVFPMKRYRGRVIPGNWDLALHRFEELAVFQAISNRVRTNAPWESTAFFHECLEEIQSGRILWGCRDQDGLKRRFHQLDELIRNIRTQGYRPGFASSLEGEDPTRLSKHRRLSEEITVNIGRQGQFLFQDGRHRLAIAKAINLPVIAIKILVRHPLWCEQRLKPIPTGHPLSGHPDLPTTHAPHWMALLWQKTRDSC